ncbi:acyltransferase [Candidatus Nomurabacteria bacterium]|nr:acyltransferase [Candidatus Nomurabacteria bacterium]
MYELITVSVLVGAVIIDPTLRKLFFRQKTPILQKHGLTPHIPYFDFLRGLAMIAVVLIHVVYFYNEYLPDQINTPMLTLNNLSRFAIPFFFITSGILLTPIATGSRPYLHFIKKKLWKLIPPYLLCCIAIALYHDFNLHDTLLGTIRGSLAVPYYFLIALFQLYLIYPFVLHFKKSPWLLPISLLITLVCYAWPVLWAPFTIPFAGRYFFFFAFGVKLREFFLNNKIEQKELPYWAALILLYTAFALALPDIYYNVRIIYGVALFSLLMILQSKISLGNKLAATIAKFGQNSLWIYLTHLVVVKAIFYTILPQTVTFSMVTLISTLSLTLSFFIAAIMQKCYQKGIRLVS